MFDLFFAFVRFIGLDDASLGVGDDTLALEDDPGRGHTPIGG